MSSTVGKPPRPGAIPSENSSPSAKQRYHGQVRSAINWLLDWAVSQDASNTTDTTASSSTGTSDFSAPPAAQMGNNLYDSNGNLVTTITGDLIGDGEIDENHLADDSVGSDAIQESSVTGDHVAAGSLTGDHLAQSSVSNDNVIPDQSLVASGGISVNGTTGALQIDISVSATGAGSGIETVINADTQYLNDGANLGITADATQITNLPATVAEANALSLMTDTQTMLPLATTIRQLLRNDGSGFYQDNQYSGGECDGKVLDGTNFLSANQAMTTSYATVGNTLQIANPGTGLPITIRGRAVLVGVDSTGTTNLINCVMQISTDGGSTYTSGACTGTAGNYTSGEDFPISEVAMTLTATPTGDIFIRVQAKKNGSTDTLSVVAASSFLEYDILNSSNGSVAGPLLATLPSTLSMACGASYPTTTCQATKTLTPTISGGKRPLSYANGVNSGSGAILTGATSLSYTLGDTETCTTGGATHATVVQSKITTSESYTITAATWSAGVATFTIGTHNMVAAQTFNSSGNTPTGWNGTGLTVSSVTSTQVKCSIASNPGAWTAGGTINAVTTITNTCTVTGTFTLTYPAVSVSVSGSNAACNVNVTGNNCQAVASLTNNVTGGDGTVSAYSNSITSGPVGVLTGATSKKWTAGYTAACPFGPTSSTCHCQATDGHSNVGSGSKVVTFSGNVLN